VYELIHAEREKIPVACACRVLRVSRSGYYDWRQRAESARCRRNRELLLLIRQIHLESNRVHGARK
jgi:hypothetical protein